jgi:hypothetical protein
MRTVLAGSALALLSPLPTAWAHEGHGAPSEHLHGADWVLWIALTALVALWLLGRRGR